MHSARIITIFLIFATIIFIFYKSRTIWKKPSSKFPNRWKTILNKWVSFYTHLNKEEKELFEYKVQEFLLNCEITGIETNVDETDKLLIAASAIIPIFAFPEWKYKNLDEVLLYPGSFNLDFKTSGKNRPVLGMVGNGYMERKMILSKQALRKGFANETDKRNTAIHEFIHLIDKMDGAVDGIPLVLLEKQYTIPWVDMIEQKIEEIIKNKSDINPYATTNRAEFFAVLGEYFFERPHLLKKKHPELYDILEEIFEQDLAAKK
ncbi:MAG: zinc-dependent peptidase [Saprospiraceae bacterium]